MLPYSTKKPPIRIGGISSPEWTILEPVVGYFNSLYFEVAIKAIPIIRTIV